MLKLINSSKLVKPTVSISLMVIMGIGSANQGLSRGFNPTGLWPRKMDLNYSKIQRVVVVFTLDFFVTSTTDDGIIQNSKAHQIFAGANTTQAVMQTNKIFYVGQGTFIAKVGCWINYYR